MQTLLNSISLTRKQKGMIAAFAGYTCFAFADTISKLLSDGYSVYQIIGTNYLIACLVLLCICKPLGGFKDILDKQNLIVQIIRGILNFVTAYVVIYSLSILPIANVYTMIFAMPFFAVLFSALFYKEKIDLLRIGLIILGFAGVLVAFRPWQGTFDVALLWPLGASVLIALMFLSAKSLKQDITIFSLGFTPLFAALLISLFFMISDFNAPHLDDVPYFLVNGILLAAALTLTSQAFRMIASSLAAPFLYTEMIWAILFGYFIFSDAPDIWMMAGASLIMISGYILVINEKH